MLVIGVFVILRKSVFELLKRILLFNFWVKKLRVRRQLIEKLDFWLGVVVNSGFRHIDGSGAAFAVGRVDGSAAAKHLENSVRF